MQKQNDLTVFLGRFEPFHNGHAEILENALEKSKGVLVLIGSSHQARTTKNPFTYEERRQMITEWYDETGSKTPLIFAPITDHPYNDQAWIREVQDAVDKAKNNLQHYVGINPTVYLTGADRDKSTWYLNAFGNFFVPDFITETHAGMDLSATQIRDILFGQGGSTHSDWLANAVPPIIYDCLLDFVQTEECAGLVKEYEFIQKYKKAWSAAPYAPTFMTVDACVIQSGHVLVIVRDNFPGKGLWAIPGGFLEQDEKLIDGSVRELIEETKISLSKAQLYGSIKSKEIFDHPDRSLRGRTITTCFLYKLDDSKPLPKTKAQRGEVSKIMWLPINEALNNPQNWFEDHYSMVSTMIGRL